MVSQLLQRVIRHRVELSSGSSHVRYAPKGYERGQDPC